MLTKEQKQTLHDCMACVLPEGVDFYVLVHDPKNGHTHALTSANPPHPMVAIVRREIDQFDADGEYQVIEADGENVIDGDAMN